METKKNGIGIASLILGIIAFCLGCLMIGIIPGIISLILGIIGLCSKDQKKGLCITGVVLSAIACLTSLIMIIAMIGSSSESSTYQDVSVDTENEIVVNEKEDISEDELQNEKESSSVEVEQVESEELQEEMLSEIISEAPQEVSEEIIEEIGGDETSCFTAGMSFETGQLKITLDSIDLDYTDYDDEYGWYTPEEGMKYIAISFTYENIGDSDAYVSIYDYDCYADGSLMEQTYYFGGDFINANISAGRNTSFETFYVVPIDAQEIELEYSELSLWSDEKIVIKLQ